MLIDVEIWLGPDPAEYTDENGMFDCQAYAWAYDREMWARSVNVKVINMGVTPASYDDSEARLRKFVDWYCETYYGLRPDRSA